MRFFLCRDAEDPKNLTLETSFAPGIGWDSHVNVDLRSRIAGTGACTDLRRDSRSKIPAFDLQRIQTPLFAYVLSIDAMRGGYVLRELRRCASGRFEGFKEGP